MRLLAAHVRAAGDQVDPVHALDVLLAATRADLGRLAGEEACANAGTGLDLARRLGRREAVDELAGAYAEACELAGRVEDACSAWVAAADNTTDPRAKARRLTRGAVVAWDLGRFADANQLLDAADRSLAGVTACPENVEVEEVRVRFAARSGDLAGLDESIARLAALGRATGSSRSRAAMVYAQVLRAHTTGRSLDGLGLADELTGTRPQRRVGAGRRGNAAPVVRYLLVLGRPDRRRGQRRGGDPPGQAKRSTRARDHPRRTAHAIVEVIAGDWAAALRRTFDDLGIAQRVAVARGAAFALATRAWFSYAVVASTRPPTGSARRDDFSGDGPRPIVTCSRWWISSRA